MSVFPSVVSPAAQFDSPVTFGAVDSTPALVLLIEDDECVANIIERTLVRAGRAVLRARDGAEGAQLFAAYKDDIGLVMIDCGLPDISGAALFSVLRRHMADLPIILTSGWDHQSARMLAEEGPSAFLPKPFSAKQIELLVEELLATAA